MAGESYVNTNGAVCIAEGGVPRTVTFKARCNISGGYWVNGSSAASAVVGSGTETYISSDIEGYTVSNQIGSAVIGLCLADTASGTYGTAAMRGTYLLPTLSGTIIGSVMSGWKVAAGSAGTVVAWCSGTIAGLNANGAQVGPIDLTVGRAMSTANSDGQFAVVSLNL